MYSWIWNPKDILSTYLFRIYFKYNPYYATISQGTIYYEIFVRTRYLVFYYKNS